MCGRDCMTAPQRYMGIKCAARSTSLPAVYEPPTSSSLPVAAAAAADSSFSKLWPFPSFSRNSPARRHSHHPRHTGTHIAGSASGKATLKFSTQFFK